MNFENIGVADSFIEKLTSLNITTPTLVQSTVIPQLLKRKSLLVASQTGSGKTLAYLLPLLQLLNQDVKCRSLKSSDVESRYVESSDVESKDVKQRKIEMIILLPTRELARQVGDMVQILCQDLGIGSALVYGGVAYEPQLEALEALPSIVVATVGRVNDLISQGVLKLSEIEYFVLDEVDQMVDLGFGDSVLELARCRREGSLCCFFSATIDSTVCAIVDHIESGVERVEVGSAPLVVDSITHSAYYVERRLMGNLLIHILRSEKPCRALVFTRSRNMADRVVVQLIENGFVAEAFHSDRSQVAREYILERFKNGDTPIVVATDVMSRGIDVDGIDYVINYGLPQSAELYIHRVGRTGRAGQEGMAISMCEPMDFELLGSIQKMMKMSIAVVANHPYYTQEVTRLLSPFRVKGALVVGGVGKGTGKSKGKSKSKAARRG